MSEITQEQKEIFRNWLIENRDNLVTIRKNKNSYTTFDKTAVIDIQKSRVWFNDGSYEDFPNHDNKELERIITT